ncbi:unnamed protein product [Owenia fusiformis]|uniref:Uncharacterized protein n=1 Tax=Owenia fusiformis TaxID=6347 RepID=A0A8J1T4V1_OWEFU|nr:unnamed protein product [Owenia fusiformis]
MSRKHTSVYDVFECDQCGKIYKSKDTLNDHVRGYHNGEFKCSQCLKKLSTRGSLRKHESQVHGNKEGLKIECDLCEDRFRSQEHLEGHLNMQHRRYAPFKCNTCKKSFHYRHSLTNHQVTCKGGQVKCRECGATFTSMSGRIDHYNAKHGDTVYKCKACDKTYPYRASLSKHMKKAGH